MSQLKIAFRTDASSQIGSGHFMRCFALADELKKQGAKVRFLSSNLPAHLDSLLNVKGFEYTPLTTNKTKEPCDELAHSGWLGTSQIQDARATVQALADQLWDWIIVDHYALDERWERAVRSSAKKLMVIDDLADRQHDCDVLLDQNYYTDMQVRYIGKVPSHCELLIGPHYSLLRDEFRLFRKQIKSRNGLVKRVLVCFGGVDADNHTERAIDALSVMSMSDVHVDVVIGSQHPCCEPIKKICLQYGFDCHVQADNIAELMAVADLAIGSGGSMIWERCCLGVPALTICTASNQQKQIEDAAKQGFLYAPTISADWVVEIKGHIEALIQNKYLRELISRSSMQMVDGRGVLRVIRNLRWGDIKIRIVAEDDLVRLFEWRNHLSIRSVSRNAEPITWEDHRRWFFATIASTDRVMLIGQIDGVSMGVVRFDKCKEDAEISIYLVPSNVGHSGQGRNLLLSAERWVKDRWPDIKYIRANVLGDNMYSHRLFLGADYQIETTNYMKRL